MKFVTIITFVSLAVILAGCASYGKAIAGAPDELLEVNNALFKYAIFSCETPSGEMSHSLGNKNCLNTEQWTAKANDICSIYEKQNAKGLQILEKCDSCIPPSCPAPPEGCEYTGVPDKDENGCPINCGKLTCPPKPECVDSDGGKNYNVKGIVSYDIDNHPDRTNTDVCISINPDGTYGPTAPSASHLVEYSCPSEINYGKEVYACQFGCRNGACKESQLYISLVEIGAGMDVLPPDYIPYYTPDHGLSYRYDFLTGEVYWEIDTRFTTYRIMLTLDDFAEQSVDVNYQVNAVPRGGEPGMYYDLARGARKVQAPVPGQANFLTMTPIKWDAGVLPDGTYDVTITISAPPPYTPVSNTFRMDVTHTVFPPV